MTSWSGYFWPGTETLRNKLGIKDGDQLDRYERQLTTERAREGCPTGDFDLRHFQSIHRHLFQDIYDWAGELRTVNFSKSGSEFVAKHQIATEFAEVHRRLRSLNYLDELPTDVFAWEAARIIGDINHIHPFREGNGRAQAQYLQQLGDRAGHLLDLRKVDKSAWSDSSRAANDLNYRPLAYQITQAVETDLERQIRLVFERDRDWGHGPGWGL